MKKLLLTFSLLICCSVSQAQQAYVPFPTAVNTVWNEGAYSFTHNNPIQTCISKQTHIVKDTTFNGVVYHQLDYYTHDRSGPIGCLPPWQGTITTGTYGYFRNDSVNKRVLFRSSGVSQDTVMYDFNLTLGDTLPPFLFKDPYAFPPTYVMQIDTITLAGIARKRFLISSPCGDSTNYIIEGIGGSSGFTYGIINPSCTGNFKSLDCMKTNGSTVYPDSSTICNLITSLDEVSLEKEPITVYPNPTKGSLNIPFVEGLEYIQVFNMQGQLIQEMKPNYSAKTTLEMQGSAGIYYIQLRFADGQQSNIKVVKQ